MNLTSNDASAFFQAIEPAIQKIVDKRLNGYVKCAVGQVKSVDNTGRKATVLLGNCEDVTDQYITIDNYSDCQLVVGDVVWVQYWGSLTNAVIVAKSKTGSETYFTGGGSVAATVRVGTTTTGAAGTSASVANGGTTSAAVLNFTIPRGDAVELRVSGGYIQWKYASGTTWTNLIAIEELKGDTGATGTPGEDGVPATHSWDGTVLTVNSASGSSSADLVGPTGPAGVSATHTWNGSVLTMQSASGVSSADLLGPGLRILGNPYASLSDLEADVTSPAVGDVYEVGESAPYGLYRWSGTAWVYEGALGASSVTIARW